jgi:hypothetical protein
MKMPHSAPASREYEITLASRAGPVVMRLVLEQGA